MDRPITTQCEFDRNRHRRNLRIARKARAARRNPPVVIASPGCRPLSTFHPKHPATLYGWADERAQNRDRRLWA